MNKVIWMCWFQGRENAPNLVEKCITSWESLNPDWEVRCLDATTVHHYLDFKRYVNFNKQTITAASASDILRILLLHEYGGVWADSTLHCNQPLSDWLPSKMYSGFFAFSRPGRDRMLASWFLASAPGNLIVTEWTKRVISYWEGRTHSKNYFWFHHSFTEMYSSDANIRILWEGIPKVSADGPHTFIRAGMLEPVGDVSAKVDWEAPLFKLTHRVDPTQNKKGTLLNYLLYERDNSAAQGNESRHAGQQLVGCDVCLNYYLTITKLKRTMDATQQNEIFIISEDERLMSYLPPEITEVSVISYYSGSIDQQETLDYLNGLMEQCEERAKLIVTTSPYCALSAIAVGIPVVVLSQHYKECEHQADLSVIALLNGLVRIFSTTEVSKVSWEGYSPDISSLKLKVINAYGGRFSYSGKSIGPLASSDKLPVADFASVIKFMGSVERINHINKLNIPDRQRWAMPSSYNVEWNERGSLAAQLIPSNSSVFEVGTGSGWFRSLVSSRCDYVGADLEPLDEQTLWFNLDYDDIPTGRVDYIVLLGVFEYLHKPFDVASKLQMADNIIISYYCRLTSSDEVYSTRNLLGWVNHFTEKEFLDIFLAYPLKITGRSSVSKTSEYEQILFKLSKASRYTLEDL